MQITIEMPSFIIHVWPKFGQAVFIEKLSAKSVTTSINILCDILEKIAKEKRK